MDVLVNECQDLKERHTKLHDTMASKLVSLKNLLEETRIAMDFDDVKALQTMDDLREKTKKIQFSRQQKEYQSSLSRFSKDIEKKFKHDLSVIYRPEAFAGKEHLVSRALAMHLIRQGQFDLCDAYMREAGIQPQDTLYTMAEHLKQEFSEMYTMMGELEAHDLSHAIEWARTHREALRKQESNLEFNLHRLRFLQLTQLGQPLQAITYSREHFSLFADKHLPEIKRLMTCILHKPDASTRYADLHSPSLWVDIRIEFQRDFCALLNMSADSPLYASVFVGTTALPVILKLHKIMSAKKTEWNQQDELPVEVPLEEELRFHSVFACPVSKEQATENNPPMMMPCGHVVCRESLERLSRSSRYGSNRNVSRFKCPYCPSESSPDQAIKVYF
ncbi:CTLH/CRA C-terminal to lish motif domain-containing protein [Spinellus fusiger]|nr:CTLH/CRA C-terminal to lish motif domain-containing protein [Spinellus fusiger]